MFMNEWMNVAVGAVLALTSMVATFWPWPWNHFSWFRRLTRRDRKADSLEFVGRFIRDHHEGQLVASGQTYRSLAEAREERNGVRL